MLDAPINKNQKVFVLGRQILDVAITTHEIIYSMDKICLLEIVLKVDISKAYDRMRWDLIF